LKNFPPTEVKAAFLRPSVPRPKTKNAIFEVKNHVCPVKLFWGAFQGFLVFFSEKTWGDFEEHLIKKNKMKGTMKKKSKKVLKGKKENLSENKNY
jgi:hypothetical protein